jgi:very-short-patch-repair endonuclease
MSQNFGPLNKAGGERRLNVAITRAKMRAIIVASISADDVTATGSQGARLLRDYLAYATSGGSREVLQVAPVQKYDLDLPLEDDVYQALDAEGLMVRRQVGCSGYRIDLAVEDPQRPGSFLLGIECDGSSYRSGKTARDRDRTRWNVLRGLGWNMHRIWSRDWVIDRKGEVQKVKVVLERAEGRETGDAPGSNLVLLEKETFLPSLLSLVRERGPVHVDIAKDVLDDHVHRPEDVDKVLSEHLYALVREGTVTVRDGFIWPGGMVVPRVRRPPGREPMELDYVSVEEIGEAELYCMGVDFHTTRNELVECTASFYGHQTLTEKARTRLEAGIDNLIFRGRLLAPGGDVLIRAR